MTDRTIGTAWLKSLSALLLALMSSWPVAAQQSAYTYTAPSGWSRSVESGVEIFTPKSQADSAQILLFAPKPMTGKFEAQFDAERASMEADWGLSAPQPVSPQRGSNQSGAYSAYFASYHSEGGPRYMSFLGLGRGGSFSMMIFVASSDEVFNRLAPQATQMWQTLQLAKTAR